MARSRRRWRQSPSSMQVRRAMSGRATWPTIFSKPGCGRRRWSMRGRPDSRPNAAMRRVPRSRTCRGRFRPQASSLYSRSRRCIVTARMHETLGAFEAAHEDYQAALRSAQACGDRHAEWQALLDTGFLWAARDYARMGEYLQRALALARALGDPLMLGHSLNR